MNEDKVIKIRVGCTVDIQLNQHMSNDMHRLYICLSYIDHI